MSGWKTKIDWSGEAFADSDEVVAARHKCAASTARAERVRRGLSRSASGKSRPISPLARFRASSTPLPDTSGMPLAEKQLAWAAAAKLGCAAAADLLLRSTERLVCREVHRFLARRRPGYSSTDAADLLAEVRASLFERIGRFNPSRAGWVTYALWWVRPTCTRWLRVNDRIVHEPVKNSARRGRAAGVTARLSLELGREPTEDELADETGISSDALRSARESGAVSVVSLEGVERVCGSDEPSALDALAELDQSRIVRSLLGRLSDRERAVIELRYGIGDGGREHRLQEIGEVFGFSRQRAQQVEMQAMQKLRKLASRAGL